MQLQWSPATSPIMISVYCTILNPLLEVLTYTSSNTDSDSDRIAEQYLYEPELENPVHFLRNLTMMKGYTTQTGKAKGFYYFGSYRAFLCKIACRSPVAYQTGDKVDSCQQYMSEFAAQKLTKSRRKRY